MEKRKVKKLKLRRGVKTAFVIALLYALFTGYLFACSERIERIENNADGYTESGHAHKIQVNFTK